MARLFSGILLILGIALAALALVGMSEAQNIVMQAAAQEDANQPPADQAAPADTPAGTDEKPAAGEKQDGADAGQAAGGTPLETAKAAEKGTLTNPHGDDETAAKEGQKIYMAAGCSGCHGGSGGGGMGPPLTNQVWIYGADDDTLFRLIALGSDGLQEQGFSRKGSEAVVGPMPAQGTIVKSDEDLWKIIAWIRSINPSSAGGSSASSG